MVFKCLRRFRDGREKTVTQSKARPHRQGSYAKAEQPTDESTGRQTQPDLGHDRTDL